MYPFISSAYLFFFPLLMILIRWAPFHFRNFLLNLRATIQVSMIVYAGYLIRQLIGLYQLRKLLHMPSNNLDFFGSGLFEMLLIILLPFLFLYHRILRTWMIGFAIWLLLLHSILKQGILLPTDFWQILSSVLFYLSLLTSIYALLWLLKKTSPSPTYSHV